MQEPGAPHAETDPAPASTRGPDESIGDVIARLVDDAEDFVKAEIALYRAEAAYRVADYRKYLAFVALAAFLSASALFLLLLAATFALAPLIGMALAALCVALLAMGIAAILFALITRKVRRVIRRRA